MSSKNDYFTIRNQILHLTAAETNNWPRWFYNIASNQDPLLLEL